MGILDGNLYENMRMIIPQHRDAMVKLSHELKRVEKPILDEDQLEEMSRNLAEAIFDDRTVQVEVYKPFGAELVEMTPVKIDPFERMLKGVGTNDTLVTVKLDDLLDVQLK